MKKFFIIVLSALLFAGVASAQPRAIGARLGGDAEVSYQHYLGTNFIQADLGTPVANDRGLRLTGVYDFAFELPNNFVCYVGPGAQLGFYPGTDSNNNQTIGFGFAVGGMLGVEYQIPTIPLNVSLDWRPMWHFIGAPSWSSAAVGVRYRF